MRKLWTFLVEHVSYINNPQWEISNLNTYNSWRRIHSNLFYNNSIINHTAKCISRLPNFESQMSFCSPQFLENFVQAYDKKMNDFLTY